MLLSAVAPATDQYALALVAYELLTGRFPYPARSAGQMMVSHASAAPDLSAAPPAAAAVLARALAKDPYDRFPSCREFVRQFAATPPDDGTALATGGLGSGGTLSGISAPTLPAPHGRSVLPAVRVFGEDGRSGGPAPAAWTSDEVVRALLWAFRLETTDVAGAGGAAADLSCRFPVRSGRPVLAEKLRWFAERWRAVPAEAGGGAVALSVAPPAGWLRRLLDRPEPVRLVVTLPACRTAARGEVTAVAVGCARRETLVGTRWPSNCSPTCARTWPTTATCGGQPGTRWTPRLCSTRSAPAGRSAPGPRRGAPTCR